MARAINTTPLAIAPRAATPMTTSSGAGRPVGGGLTMMPVRTAAMIDPTTSNTAPSRRLLLPRAVPAIQSSCVVICTLRSPALCPPIPIQVAPKHHSADDYDQPDHHECDDFRSREAHPQEPQE